MKHLFSLLVFALLCVANVAAQDDDVYFVPKKQPKAERTLPARSSYTPITSSQTEGEEADWTTGRTLSDYDIDAYNRRYDLAADTLSPAPSEGTYLPDLDSEAYYTQRLVRFHSPRVGVWVASPYYLYTGYYDPWWGVSSFYDPWWGLYTPTYYGWGWHNYGWNSYYAWNWGWGWNYPYYHWHAHHPVWGGSWSGSYHPSRAMTQRRLTNYRPSGSYAQGRRGVSTTPSRTYRNATSAGNRTPSSGYRNTAPSRTQRIAPSSGYSNRTTPQRDYPSSTRTTRSYSAPSAPSRSYSAPSRSGGGRSGGGGGYSRSGRR